MKTEATVGNSLYYWPAGEQVLQRVKGVTVEGDSPRVTRYLLEDDTTVILELYVDRSGDTA